MTNPTISIIIPVYNAAAYLDDCINSIINQTYASCEFIFINDGSSDESQLVIEKHLVKDFRIILINQENKGVSVARNRGLAIAKGKYIGFVDADDWLEKEMYQTLFDAIESTNCDLVLTNIIGNRNGVKYFSSYSFPTDRVLNRDYIQDELLPYLIKNDDLYSSCNKLFKASIIQENAIIFPIGNALSEDNIFNMLYFNKIASFKYVDYSGYNYREVEGSATRNIYEKDYFQNVLKIFKFDYRSFMDLKISDDTIVKLKSEKLINNVISLINIYFNSGKQMSFAKRYRYIRAMIYDENVQTAFKINFDTLFQNKNRYEKFIFQSIKSKSMLKLYLATAYSRFRNRH
jgi:glycosyltransferase involved in cell wall biosynthesis